MRSIKKLGKYREINLDYFPSRFIEKGSKPLGLFLLVFSFTFTGFPAFMLVWSIINDKFEPASLAVITLFIAIGIAVFIIAINKLAQVESIFIDYEKVQYKYRSLFRKTEWAEPLSGYEGILLKTEVGGKHTFTTLELHHNDTEKSVKLAVYLYNWIPEDKVRERWEYYSQKLKLPALSIINNEIVKRDFNDLNKSVSELVKEKKLEIDSKLDTEVPEGISYGFEAGLDIITVIKKKTLALSTAVLVLFLLLLVYIGFFIGETRSFMIVGIFGALVGSYVILYTLWDLISDQQLRIGHNRFHALTKTRFGITKGKKITMSEIEEVKIDKEPYQKLQAVIIRTDTMKIKIGEGLSVESLNWLKDYIINKISER